uniref:Exonuclease domain-containing protein n=1 Tax=Strongyloides venezuelensis TaxID=75913 RepID=A0A0K0F4S2_STRVS
MYKIIRLHHSKGHNDAVIKSLIEALKLIGTNMYLRESINYLSTPSSDICNKLKKFQMMDDQKLKDIVNSPCNELSSLPHQ